MKIRLLVTATLLAAAATTVQAQGKTTADQQCRGGTVAAAKMGDACQKAIDLFSYMAPQLGTAMAGGNATLGQPSSLGGLFHFSLGFRATAVKGSVPDFKKSPAPDSGAPVSSMYETKDAPVPMPAVDLAIGLFKGIPIGITNLGGVDLLLSAAYVPEADIDEVSLKTPNGSLKLGFGARLGLLQEGSVSPGVSVTYMQRGLPIMDITGIISNGNQAEDDSIFIRKLDISTSSWRVVASKKLMFLGLAVGYGMDSYKLSTDVSAVVKEPCLTGICTYAPGTDANGNRSSLATFDSDVSRSNLFANLSLGLGGFKLVGEVGQVSGGDIKTFNTYKDKPDVSRQYASVGFRIGF
jgi:hypothetical protein